MRHYHPADLTVLSRARIHMGVEGTLRFLWVYTEEWCSWSRDCSTFLKADIGNLNIVEEVRIQEYQCFQGKLLKLYASQSFLWVLIVFWGRGGPRWQGSLIRCEKGVVIQSIKLVPGVLPLILLNNVHIRKYYHMKESYAFVIIYFPVTLATQE